ncbi:MAG: hypothetical protein Q9201_003219 [Fulgogasparrea decipioides]
MWTNFKFFFGRVEFVVKAAPGTGIVSSMVLLSDDLDEIDWEFLGGVTSTVQTNYFGKGYTGTYNRSTTPSVSSPQTTFHTYALDWSPTSLVWSIDGATVRMLNAADADSNALVGSQYPQTPMKVSLSLWDAGDPDAATKGWGGGVTPIPPPEPYTMYVKSVKIWNTNPAEQYQYTDRSGSYKSIEVIKEPPVSSSSSQPPGQITKTLSLGSTGVTSTSATVKASSSSQSTHSSSKPTTADSKASTPSGIPSSLGAKTSAGTTKSTGSSAHASSSIDFSVLASSAASAVHSTTFTWLPTSHGSTSTIRNTLTRTTTNCSCSSTSKTATATISASSSVSHTIQISDTTWGYAYPEGFESVHSTLTTTHPLAVPGANANTTSVQAHGASVSVSTWKSSTVCTYKSTSTTQHVLVATPSSLAFPSTNKPPAAVTSLPMTDSQYSLIYYGPTKSFTVIDTLSAKSLSISLVTKTASSSQAPVSATSMVNGATTPSTTAPAASAYSVSYFTLRKSFTITDSFLPFGDVSSNSLAAASRSKPTLITTPTSTPETKALITSSTPAGALSSPSMTPGRAAGGSDGGAYSVSYFTPGKSFTIVDSFVPFGDVSSKGLAASSRAASLSAPTPQITTSSAPGSMRPTITPSPAETLIVAASSSTAAIPSYNASSDSATDEDTDLTYTSSATMTLSKTDTQALVTSAPDSIEVSSRAPTPTATDSSSGEGDSSEITNTLQKALTATATASSLYGADADDGSDSDVDDEATTMALPSTGSQSWATSSYIKYPSNATTASTFLLRPTSPAASAGSAGAVWWATAGGSMVNGTIPFHGSAPPQLSFGAWAVALVILAMALGVAGEV